MTAAITIQEKPRVRVSGNQLIPMANGGIEGASNISRELASWRPAIVSPDSQINKDKEILDARGRDRMLNDGYVMGASAIHKDSIVGGKFRLNATPNYKILGLDEKWAEEFQEEVEAKFQASADSERGLFDATGVNNFTSLIRLGICTNFTSGESFMSAEWDRSPGRPFRTCIQVIDPDRISNPLDAQDSIITDRQGRRLGSIRRGIEKNRMGKPIAYHVRNAHKNDFSLMGNVESLTWTRVSAAKPWGRQMMLHIFEQQRPEQSRGIADMVSVLKQMKMTSRFQDLTLQAAALNATYAASIESELPSEAIYQQLGYTGTTDTAGYAERFMESVNAFNVNNRGVYLDGVKIPHFFPGTKLRLQNPGAPNGLGGGFEESLLRHVAAALGLSYEQFSRDYTKTNYSSARASINESWKFMMAKKALVADRMANFIYSLWLEEMLNTGQIYSLPRNAPSFYYGINKEAYCSAAWMGPARGAIDPLKEAKASEIRLKSTATLESECAMDGLDYREVILQRGREKKLLEKAGLTAMEVVGTLN